MLELIGIPKTKTKKNQIERILREKIVSSRRERKKKQKERIRRKE